MTGGPKFNGTPTYRAFVFSAEIRTKLANIFDAQLQSSESDLTEAALAEAIAKEAFWGSALERRRQTWIDGLQRATNWAHVELCEHNSDVTLEEALAELRAVSKLTKTRESWNALALRLRKLSPSIDAAIGPLLVSPVDIAERIEASNRSSSDGTNDLLTHPMESFGNRVVETIQELTDLQKHRAGNTSTWKVRRDTLDYNIAIGLAMQVRDVFNEAEIPFTAVYRIRIAADVTLAGSPDHYISAAVKTLTIIARTLGLSQLAPGSWSNLITQVFDMDRKTGERSVIKN